MDLGLSGKVALVTAASRGLGKAVALRLAQEGTSVAICARGRAQLDEAASQIRSSSDAKILPLTADLADENAAGELIDATLSKFDRLDILVTNAGGPPPGQFLDLTPPDWEMATQLTLMSAVRLCYAALPAMKEQGEGSILAITSVTVKQPLPNLILSNSLRLAVAGLIRTLANEMGPVGIRANAICPGWTRTTRVDQLLADRAERSGTTAEEEEARITNTIPLGRLGDTEEFAAAATFLVSPAASYINGVCLLVDGGMYRGMS